MRVLFGYLSAQYRGGTKFQVDFAREFRDFQVGFITSNSKLDYEDLVEDIGPIYRIPPTRQIAKRIKVLRALAADYDIIYLNKAVLNPFEFFIVKMAGFRKIILHSHSTGKDCENKLVKALYEWMHILTRGLSAYVADQLYACSEAAGVWLFGKKNRNNFKIVNNGIDVELYRYDPAVREAVRQELQLTGSVILHVGSFSAVKNQGYLVDAFAHLKQACPDCTLLLAGDGELMEQVQAKVRDMGLVQDVRFLGQRRDVERLMQAADVFVLPSKLEGLPFVAVEAQSAGLPCIITSAATEQAKIVENCRFYDVSNPTESLAAAIMESLDLPRKDQADAVIAAGFDIKSCARDLEADLKKLLAE